MAARPHQTRWQPLDAASAGAGHTFATGMHRHAGAGDPAMKAGLNCYVYACADDMEDEAFVNADGDMLIVAQQGVLDVQTELGRLWVAPGEICVVPRGFAIRVRLPAGPARGYVAEVFDGHFRIPDLGPIGANGLAAPRDFQAPTAHYEDAPTPMRVSHKYLGQTFSYTRAASLFDVVGWHGNYFPFKYDLARFMVINATLFDHADPSIFTVLTVQTAEPGTAACDFVVFPPRWGVQLHTFRPPYYHRNCMSEYMGLIRGAYEAKGAGGGGAKGGFVEGGSSLHSHMTAHGPDSGAFSGASAGGDAPQKVQWGDLAFMFESYYTMAVAEDAWESGSRERGYNDHWVDLPRQFDPSKRDFTG